MLIIKEYLPEDNKITSDYKTIKYCQPPIGYRRIKNSELTKELINIAVALLNQRKPYGYVTEFKLNDLNYKSVVEWHFNSKKKYHYAITIYIKI